jgi:hypothetical protein
MAVLSILCGLGVSGVVFLLWVLYHFILESRRPERRGRHGITVNILLPQRRMQSLEEYSLKNMQ